MLLGAMAVPHSEKSVVLRYIVGLGYALLLAGTILRPGRLLRAHIFGFYGKISYSTYLSHAPIVFMMSPVYAKIYSIVPFDFAYPLCALLTIAIVTPVAWLLYRYIEQPGIRLGHTLVGSHRPIRFGQ